MSIFTKKKITGEEICIEIEKTTEEIKNLINKLDFLKNINVSWYEKIPFSKKELFKNMTDLNNLVTHYTPKTQPTFTPTDDIGLLFYDFLKYINELNGYRNIVTEEYVKLYLKEKSRNGSK